MIWIFRSKVGTFRIQPYNVLGWALFVGNEHLGDYEEPQAAADNVYMGVTTYEPWDSRFDLHDDAPTDLGEWERVRYVRRV